MPAKSRCVCPKKKIVFLLGPTGIGKSAAAIILAKKINAEIVSCDSMQVYRRMDILTSAVTSQEKKKVAHHLIGFLEPDKEFDAAQYRQKAMDACTNIYKKGKIPLFTGGSGLYYSAIVDGLFPGVTADAGIRARLEKQLKAKGSLYLHRRLAKVDRVAAQKIHSRDSRRIIRALEVYVKSGKPISALQKERRGLGKEYAVKAFALNLDRPQLYARINARVVKMFGLGLVKEVEKLMKRKLGRTAQRAIGVPEIRGYLKGEHTLERAQELMQRNSRHYAKRQFTWFRKDKRIKWINIKANDTAAAIAGRISKEL